MSRPKLGLGFVLVLAMGIPRAHARAEDDPAARALFDDVVKAYKALPGYADAGKLAVELKLHDQPARHEMPLAIRFGPPRKLAVDAGTIQVFCDGSKITSAILPLKRFSVVPAGKTLSTRSFENDSLGAFMFSGPSAEPLQIVLALLTDQDPASAILHPTNQLLAEEDRDGLKVLLIKRAQGFDTRLAIDPATRLVERIELLLKANAEALDRPLTGASEARIVWSAGKINTEAQPDKAFEFHAPDGFTQVAELSTRKVEGGRQKSPLQELVGKPAPDFTVTVLDGPGKTRELRKADLAGKVVLIDFWATWCGPCMAELPEIQKLIADYARRQPDRVVVLALSQDSEPGDLDDIRKLVETTLKEKDLKLNERPVGLVALDPLKAVGKAYHVSGIPTVVVLDTKGVVQSVHIGFRPDVLEILTDELNTLLEGGSLVEDEPQPAAKR